jgi:hypothetical protein
MTRSYRGNTSQQALLAGSKHPRLQNLIIEELLAGGRVHPTANPQLQVGPEGKVQEERGCRTVLSGPPVGAAATRVERSLKPIGVDREPIGLRAKSIGLGSTPIGLGSTQVGLASTQIG